MENPKSSETLAEDSQRSKANRALEDASGLSVLMEKCNGSVLDSEVSAAEDCRKIVGNVVVAPQVVEVQTRMEDVKEKNLDDGVNLTDGVADSCVGFGKMVYLVDEASSPLGSTDLQSAVPCESDKKGLEGKMSVPGVQLVGCGNEGIAFEKTVKKGNKDDGGLVSNGDSVQKVEVFGNGISLVVEVCGPSNGLVQNGNKDLGGRISLPEVQLVGSRNGDIGSKKAVSKETEEDDGLVLNGVDSAHKVEVLGDGISLVVEVCGPSNGLVHINDASCLGLMKNEKNVKEQGEEKKKETTDSEDSIFSVGDIVWVKTKSESWWPGLIHDPLTVPKYAAECPPKNRLLIGYIGSGSFSWCRPSWLKSFNENFNQMSKESKSRCFIAAVEKAVGEIGKRVKLEMTCPCILEGKRTALAHPLTNNADTKGEVSEPDLKLGEFSVSLFEPAKFLAHLKLFALAVSVPSMLEFAVVRSRLSAFYSALGHSQLPMHLLRGADDPENSRNDSLKPSSLDDQTGHHLRRVGLCTRLNNGCGKTHPNSLQKQLGDSEDEVLRSKQNEKLIKPSAGDMNVEPEHHRGGIAEQIRIPTKMALKYKRKRKKDSEVRSDGNATEGFDGSRPVCHFEGEASLTGSEKTKESKGFRLENDDGGIKDNIERSFESRERKKSKYLSPPYVNNFGCKNSPVSGDKDTENCKIPKGVNVAACQDGGASPIEKCGGNKLKKKKRSEKFFGKSGSKECVNASSSELLHELHFAALDCLYPCENRNFDAIRRFFSRFRSSVYCDRSSYEMNSKHKSGQQDISNAESVSVGICPLEPQITFPSGKSGTKKRKNKIMVISENLCPLEPQITFPSGKSGTKKRKNKIMVISENLKVEHAVGKSGMKGNADKPGSLEPRVPFSTGESGTKKREKKLVGSSEKLKVENAAGIPAANGNADKPGSLDKDMLGMDHLSPEVKSGKKMRRKKDKMSSMGSKTILTDGLLDLNGSTATNTSFTNTPQEIGPTAFDGILEQKKRKEEGLTIEKLQADIMGGLPDLNGNGDIPGSLVADSQFMGFVAPKGKLVPKKRKKTGTTVCEHFPTGSTSGLLDINGSNPKSVMMDLPSPKSIPMSTDQEEKEKTNSSGLKDNNGICAKSSSLVNDSLDTYLLSAEGKPGFNKKRRKRKEKTTSDLLKTKPSAGIPDLNGNNEELSSLGLDMNACSSDVKPKQKRRRMKKGEASLQHSIKNPVTEIRGMTNGEVLDVKPKQKRRRMKKGEASLQHSMKNPVTEIRGMANGEALGAALLLTFAPGVSLPSKEVLIGTFCRFGRLKESEILVRDSGCAEVVFARSSDAVDAFRSLEKSSPFGLSLLNYKLHYFSAPFRTQELDTNMRISPMSQSSEGLKSSAKPSVFNPHAGETPPLFVMRKNLEMMASMLEKSGDNLSPEMRAKLEGEINGLLKKVSIMEGSSSS